MRHTLSPKIIEKVRQIATQREYLLTLRTESLFKKMKHVVPKMGSQLLRNSKISRATEGAEILDAKLRHDQWSGAKHLTKTQLAYRSAIKE